MLSKMIEKIRHYRKLKALHRLARELTDKVKSGAELTDLEKNKLQAIIIFKVIDGAVIKRMLERTSK